MSDLVFLANISLAGYHLLFSLWFLTVDSACHASEDLSLLLHTLLCVLRKIFLLLYNNSARTYFLISYAATTRTSTDVTTTNHPSLSVAYTTTRTSGDPSITVNNNNNSYTTTRTSGDLSSTGTNNNNIYAMAVPAVLGDWSKLEDIYFRFGEHYTPDLVWINKAFDITYGSNLSDVDAIFDDGSARTQLKSDAIQVLIRMLSLLPSHRSLQLLPTPPSFGHSSTLCLFTLSRTVASASFFVP